MRVVVTGGAGFIGSNLCEALANDDAVTGVVALDDLSNGFAENLDGIDAELIVGSILDPDVLDTACDGADAIVHLAARGSVPKSVQDPIKSHERNATGTLQVMEAARRAGNIHVISASSSSVYGATEFLPKHEDLPTRPMSPYAVTKIATEWYTIAYQYSYGLPTLAFRFFNVYGPRQPAGHAYAAVIPAWIDAALDRNPLFVNGDGKQSRDFTYVDTVTGTVIDALKRQTTSEVPVNLAFGGGTTLLELIGMLETSLGYELDVQHRDARVGDIRHSTADATRLYELFPDIEPIGFDEGLEKTIAWWRNQRGE